MTDTTQTDLKKELKAIIAMTHAYGLLRGIITGVMLRMNDQEKDHLADLLDEAAVHWTNGMQYFNQSELSSSNSHKNERTKGTIRGLFMCEQYRNGDHGKIKSEQESTSRTH